LGKQSKVKKKALELFNKGNKFLSNKNFKEAIKYHKRAVEIDPTFANCWGNLGGEYYEIKDFKNALICFNKAIELNPQNHKYWDNKGLLLIMHKNYNEAVQCFNESLKININNPIAKQNRKYALHHLKKTDFASGFMQEFMEPSPEEIQSATKDLRSNHTSINQQEVKESEAEAENLIYKGNFEDIIILCDSLLKRNSSSAMGWFWKGKALSALARDEEAVSCYAKSYDLQKWHTCQTNYILTKSRLGDKSSKDRMRIMDRKPELTDLYPSAENWNSKGAYTQTFGKFEEALYCYEKALELDPNYRNAVRNKERVIRLLKEEGLYDPNKEAKKGDVIANLDEMQLNALKEIEGIANQKFELVTRIKIPITPILEPSRLEVIIKDNKIIEIFLLNVDLERLPESIGNLTYLEKLVCIGSYFKNRLKETPESLGKLQSLKNLNLKMNELSDMSLIKGLNKFERLKTLILTSNEIVEIKNLENLKNLRWLDLSNNKISEIEGLDTLKNLRTLILSNNKIKEIKNLENLINLTDLRLSSNKIPDDVINEIIGNEASNRLFSRNGQLFVEYCRRKTN
jgi:tetratricopeptide (TPR) repeat protein